MHASVKPTLVTDDTQRYHAHLVLLQHICVNKIMACKRNICGTVVSSVVVAVSWRWWWCRQKVQSTVSVVYSCSRIEAFVVFWTSSCFWIQRLWL